MTLLVVHYDSLSETYAVVNTFDGVIVDRFYTRVDAEVFSIYTRVDAEDFARSAEANEAYRIQVQYPDA